MVKKDLINNFLGENNKFKLFDIDYLVFYDEYMWFLYYVGI